MSRKHSTLLMGVAAAALATAALNATPAAAQTAPANGPVKPYYGNLRPFYGNLRPFYGNLRPFYGNLRPFWGNLRPFWGDTAAFYGDLKSFWAVSNPVVGAGAPQYAKVGDFWTKAGDDWTVVFNSASSASPDEALISSKVATILNDSRNFWGASVQAKTGKSFDEGFLLPFLAARGLDDADSFNDLNQDELALLFLDYYDGLMAYAGTDHVDHWMKTVNWTPALTKTQGSGASTTIGILDETFLGDASISGNVVKSNGVSDFTNGHGAAVGSLIVGHHDGVGVMGIAPQAKVIAYNPFDSTGTANWNDVTRGVQNLKANGASVVNMSLGVPGTTMDNGWNSVFTDLSVMLTLKNTVFVIAAGNDGVTQTKNVTWNALNPAFIVVGSVGVNGEISNFSNRPGEACMTTLGLCLGDKLKEHFIVAPGELILVSDGKGGVTRQTGTSFAAPLVSGAIALLHDRWPWLANYPRETVNIILESAKDLGAPGVDGVYGHGLLDVTASQSPLDFNKLTFFTVENGKMKPQTKSAVMTRYTAVQQGTWSTAGDAYFYAFEPLGLLTRRDFAIPLSSKLIGQNVTTYMGAQEQFQAYLLTRMDAWVKSGGRNGYASGFSQAMAVPNPWGMDMTVSVAPRQARYGFRDEGPAYQSRFDVTSEKTSLVFGFGDGAPQLAASTGFASAGSYDIDRGGADPLLGLASGGVYVGLNYKLSDKLTFSAGALSREQERDRSADPAFAYIGHGAERYEANAQRFALAYKPTGELTLTGAWTRLNEGSGLLGVQSLDADDFRKGSTTDGYSLSVNWTATPKLSFMATGSMARTHASDGQALSVGKEGLTSSSFEVGFATTDVFQKGDRFQVMVSQPMFVEKGRLEIQQVEVIDRQTGDLGIVTRGVDIAGQRRIAGEVIYLKPVQGGLGDVALFGRIETPAGDGAAAKDEYLTGARYRIAF